MTQDQFARALRIPVSTLRNWEQGRVLPDPAARSLWAIVAKNPKAALKSLATERRRARRAAGGSLPFEAVAEAGACGCTAFVFVIEAQELLANGKNAALISTATMGMALPTRRWNRYSAACLSDAACCSIWNETRRS